MFMKTIQSESVQLLRPGLGCHCFSGVAEDAVPAIMRTADRHRDATVRLIQVKQKISVRLAAMTCEDADVVHAGYRQCASVEVALDPPNGAARHLKPRQRASRRALHGMLASMPSQG